MSEQTPSSPLLPWQTWFKLKLLLAVRSLAVRKDGTINRKIVAFVEPKSPAHVKPRNGVSTTDITIDPSKNLWFRLFTPSHPTPTAAGSKLPVIIYFHGGGFSFYSSAAKVFDSLCCRFAHEIPAVVISVNYRLSPENRFPAPYDDGENVLKWLAANSSGCLPETADLSRCFLIGDSAGGNIAHNVWYLYATAAAEEFGPLRMAGIVAIQPFFGGEERLPTDIRMRNGPIVTLEGAERLWKWFLPEGSNRDHPAANVFGPNAPDISGLADFPATLVVIGGFNPLQDWQRRYYEGVRRRGKVAELVEYPGAIHGFYIFPELPEGSMLVGDIKAFIEKHGRVES